MELRNLILAYLSDYPLMTVASIRNGLPWTCTVYFAFDDELNLYFISKMSRRHSQEIDAESNVAVAVCRPHLDPFETPCRGLQAEGTASRIEDGESARNALDLYLARFPKSVKLHSQAAEVLGFSERRIYRIRPGRFVLFDEENFSTSPQQELILDLRL